MNRRIETKVYGAVVGTAPGGGLKAWAVDTGLRAVKTGAQSAVALVTANTAGLTAVSWGTVLDVAGLAVVVSVLHNLSNLNPKWIYLGGNVQPAEPESADLGPVI